MKRTIRILVLGLVLVLAAPAVKAQAIKTNVPLLLVGTPNVGMEFTVSQQFTTNLDILWMPYMFKKHEEVLRALVGSADLRYYVKPRYYYTNNMYDGFYLGPYVEAGNFNIGFWRGEERESYRYKGWGISAGLSLGYKFYLSKRFRLDLNLGGMHTCNTINTNLAANGPTIRWNSRIPGPGSDPRNSAYIWSITSSDNLAS